MFEKIVPWSLRGVGPFLNSYGDAVLFRKVRKTPPIETNPDAGTGIHSAVPHRYIHAYLVAIKSFLQYHRNVAVFIHDDGSLRPADKALVRRHLIGAKVIDRQDADARFLDEVREPLLSKVRSSYTSYLKLFDPTLYSEGKKIIILDTDTIFLRRPDVIIDWIDGGIYPWYHRAPRGKMKERKSEVVGHSQLQKVHIQTLLIDNLESINQKLCKDYRIEQGFCSGFIGYEPNTIRFDELHALFEILYGHLGDRIFQWGAEQTTHGLILCAAAARSLPVDEYFVFTQNTARRVGEGTFIHFVGENRFYRMIYPRVASRVLNGLINGKASEFSSV
jgi:hypothetical protein